MARKRTPPKVAKKARRSALPPGDVLLPIPDTRGGRNVRWIEAMCRVPEGAMVGQPVRLLQWQREIIYGIYDNPHLTRRGIISFGRKNGKTALAAFLLLLHLCGPESRVNGQLYSAAQSKEQAAVLFGLAAKSVRYSPDLSRVVVIRDTVKQLFCPQRGTLYRALSAEAKTAFGLSPVFIVHDELGQVKGPRSTLYEALETATAAQVDPLSIVISTQAPTDSDLLSILIDDAKAGHDPKVKLFLYSANDNLDPFSEEAIKAANPAYGYFQNPAEVKAMAADAKRMPSRQAEFENLVLNRRVEAVAPFVSRITWAACGAPVRPLQGCDVYGGLDLSQVNDLTAAVFIGKLDGVWNVHPTFWLPGEGLSQKAADDRQPYDVWRNQGFLQATPGPTVDYDFVAKWLYEFCLTHNVKKIAFDRWNWANFKPWLIKAGFPEEYLEAVFVQFGQGFQSISPALRDFEAEILNNRLAHGMHPVLAMCAANAVVQSDPAGNRKLNKAKSAGRIDGMVATTMAFGVAPLGETALPPDPYADPNFRMAV